MGVQMLSAHFFDQVAQAVGLRVQVGMIYLMHVTGKDDLGVLSGTGDNSL
jgi:hypothetical protein